MRGLSGFFWGGGSGLGDAPREGKGLTGGGISGR